MAESNQRQIEEDAQRDRLKLLMRRYFTWTDSGMQDDPWLASGVGQAQRLDNTRVKGSKPGSRAPAASAELEPADPVLIEVHRVYCALGRIERDLLRWKCWEVDEEKHGAWISNAVIARRWGEKSVKPVQRRWTILWKEVYRLLRHVLE